jgi:hypothetical protein
MRSSARDALDEFGVEALCAAILDGTTMTQIARDIPVSIGSLIAWVAATAERSARVKEARAQSALVWDERALRVVEEATDPFELAKAREIGHHLRWRASKIAPREYGDKVQHTGDGGGPLAATFQIVTGVERGTND